MMSQSNTAECKRMEGILGTYSDPVPGAFNDNQVIVVFLLPLMAKDTDTPLPYCLPGLNLPFLMFLLTRDFGGPVQ